MHTQGRDSVLCAHRRDSHVHRHAREGQSVMCTHNDKGGTECFVHTQVRDRVSCAHTREGGAGLKGREEEAGLGERQD